VTQATKTVTLEELKKKQEIQEPLFSSESQEKENEDEKFIKARIKEIDDMIEL